ncbi:MAG: hypothetical protein ACD_76C00096G0004 [uncultured bacterium]|nr:MAG: hypothetical protein ACD_76C00096G0004 [uncultured bacterium]HBD05508.1 hypothetical protein [Candidatus Uhrbacteria bacterium]
MSKRLVYIIGLLILGIVVAGMWIWQTKQAPAPKTDSIGEQEQPAAQQTAQDSEKPVEVPINTQDEQDQVEQQDEIADEPASQAPSEEVKAAVFAKYTYTLPGEWNLTLKAEKLIQSLASGQQIQFGIVKNTSDEKLVYFAGSVYNQDNDSNMINIYEFNTESQEFERKFKREYSAGDLKIDSMNSSVIPVFHVLAYLPENLLLVLSQNIDDSPGLCADPLLLNETDPENSRALFTLDLKNPYSGFKLYDLTTEEISVLKEKESKCLEGLGAE